VRSSKRDAPLPLPQVKRSIIPFINHNDGKTADMLSEQSHKTGESNGFNSVNTKSDRFYKDGACTFYTGRLYSNTQMGNTMSNFNSTTNKTFNKGIRTRDTFLSLFPNYRVY
jgi:hypothetical protein